MREDRPLQWMACRSLLMLTLIAVGVVACVKPANQSALADVDYWTCAMHPSVHSDQAGKCPICGMDLVPVTKQKGDRLDHRKSTEFTVPVQRQEQIGVTYTEVRRRPMRFEIRSVGTLEVDQAQVFECVSGVDGYIQNLQVTSPGERVKIGQALMTIFTPDLRSPEQELISLLKVHDNGNAAVGSMDQLIDSARRRLLLLNVSQTEISELERTRELNDHLLVRSSFDGVVSEAPMKTGMSVKRGDKLMTLLNLSPLWLWADFFENEVGLLKEGQRIRVVLPAVADQSFDGTISVIGPTIDPLKRTAKVRVDIPNPGGQLRPGMYANVVAEIDAGEGLTIPSDSVLPMGLRMLAFVDKGAGKLEPRFVQVGRQFVDLTDPNQERYYQVTDGLKEGERIVSSANFLIDAEAQVQGAMRDFR
jgi:RND family efflux transporter MFP subunit